MTTALPWVADLPLRQPAKLQLAAWKMIWTDGSVPKLKIAFAGHLSTQPHTKVHLLAEIIPTAERGLELGVNSARGRHDSGAVMVNPFRPSQVQTVPGNF